jgi:anti-sigma factor RsiW
MTSHTRHFSEEIQELADNRLTPAARVEVENHLALCEQCRGEFEALRWTKQLSRKQYANKSAPAKLEENILAALDLEDRTLSNKPVLSWNWWPKKRAMLAYSFMLFILAVLVVFYFILREPSEKSPQLSSKPESATKPESTSRPNAPTKPESPTKPELPPETDLSLKTELPTKPRLPTKAKLPAELKSSSRPDLPSEVARGYQNYTTDKLPLMLKTEDVKEMEKFFSEAGIPFKTRVFDLGMMNYRLLGGRTHKLITRKSAFFVYRGKDDDILICQMYPGRVTELPAGAVLRENKGIQFYIYRVKDLTVAFWQEGAVICVLTSDMSPEQLVQLAFAKAVKV